MRIDNKVTKARKDKNKPHSKEIIIDWELVDSLFAKFLEGNQVAARLGMHPDTLAKRIEEEKHTSLTAYRNQKRAKGEALLKEVQFELALGRRKKNIKTGQITDEYKEKPNTIMSIFLGKNYLNQSDNIKTQNLNIDGGKIQDYDKKQLREIAKGFLNSDLDELDLTNGNADTNKK